MSRTLSVPMVLLLAAGVRGDVFDNYTNAILPKAPEAAGVKELVELPSETILEHADAIPGLPGALVVVQTNDNRWAKLLVTAAAQKFQPDPKAPADVVPMLRIDRFLSYREASERAVKAEGRNVSLFPGFHLNLDMGQIVPAKFGGDLTVVETKPRQFAVKTVGKAKLYLLTKPMPEAGGKKGEKFQFGGKFDAKYFTGTYQLNDDGRRTGTLRLTVGADNDVTGTFVSELDGSEYEVRGSVAKPANKILFTIKFPRTEQAFEGYMFTGNGKAIAGTSKLEDRDAGFYATRVEE
ncbi:MAG: hypothetical protein ACJ8F7_13140 [Gemmataceae bacterium]